MPECGTEDVDLAYLEAYRQIPMDTPDEWGDLVAFLNAAARA
ncbi:hypothetical protein [Ornithinimicrobium faecis]|nr:MULTISPECIES: hypothetical protein [unclassified Ornithinimicrobium]